MKDIKTVGIVGLGALGTMYAAMAVGCILSSGEAVLAKIAGNYFRNELKAGTPFTMDAE